MKLVTVMYIVLLSLIFTACNAEQYVYDRPEDLFRGKYEIQCDRNLVFPNDIRVDVNAYIGESYDDAEEHFNFTIERRCGFESTWDSGFKHVCVVHILQSQEDVEEYQSFNVHTADKINRTVIRVNDELHRMTFLEDRCGFTGSIHSSAPDIYEFIKFSSFATKKLLKSLEFM